MTKIKKITYFSIALIILIIAYFLISYQIENNRWKQCKKTNTISLYEHYLNTYENGKYVEIAKKTIDSLLWADAIKVKTSLSFDKYLKRSYFKFYKQLADSLYEESLWSESASKNSLDSYERYNKYSEKHKYIEDSNWNEILLKIALEEDISNGNSTNRELEILLENYFKKFQYGKYIVLANYYLENLIWSRICKTENIEQVDNFLTRFPNTKFKTNAKNRIDEIKLIEKRKSDLSWLLGEWDSDEHSFEYILELKDSQKFDFGNSAQSFMGTYSVNDSTLTLNINRRYRSTITYSNSSVSGSYVDSEIEKCNETDIFIINYLDMSLKHNGYIYYNKSNNRFANVIKLKTEKAQNNPSNKYKWLRGTWTVNTNYGSSTLIIHDSRNASQDGVEGNYTIENDCILFRDGSGVAVKYTIDIENKSIIFGGGYRMRRVRQF